MSDPNSLSRERFSRALRLVGVARWGHVGEMRVEAGNLPLHVWPAQVGAWKFELCRVDGCKPFAREASWNTTDWPRLPGYSEVPLHSVFSRVADELGWYRLLDGSESSYPRTEAKLNLLGWDRAELLTKHHWIIDWGGAEWSGAGWTAVAGTRLTFNCLRTTDPAALRLYCDFALGDPEADAARRILLDRLKELHPELDKV